MDKLGETEEGRQMLQDFETRVDRALAERVRHNVEGSLETHPASDGQRSGERWRAPPDDGSRAETSGEVLAQTPQAHEASAPIADEAEQAAHQGGGASSGADAYDPGMDVDFIEQAQMLNMIMVLGTEKKSYRREAKKAMRHLVSEVYSPPRLTK